MRERQRDRASLRLPADLADEIVNVLRIEPIAPRSEVQDRKPARTYPAPDLLTLDSEALGDHRGGQEFFVAFHGPEQTMVARHV